MSLDDLAQAAEIPRDRLTDRGTQQRPGQAVHAAGLTADPDSRLGRAAAVEWLEAMWADTLNRLASAIESDVGAP